MRRIRQRRGRGSRKGKLCLGQFRGCLLQVGRGMMGTRSGLRLSLILQGTFGEGQVEA